jgi:RNA polymerase sigma-70 factor (ECF subfamily)
MSESTAEPARVLSNKGWISLVQRIAVGDSGALSDFYDEASRYVHAIAMRILRDPEEAEEITLDVFQQVWRLAGSYNPDRCAVTSWLAMMARSRALDRWRAIQSRRRLLAPEPAEGVDRVSPEAGPEAAVVATQQQTQLRSALSTLPDEQRKVIALAFLEGLSHSEVAARTGVPLGTVKTRIRLGMLRLREELEHAGH